jgi:LuxR family maltose regulon positive regulatory protein
MGCGIRILTLAFQRHDPQQEIENLLVTFAGSHRHLLEYFATEVLDAQPGSIQDFLLRTSVLTRLTGALCDTITGGITVGGFSRSWSVQASSCCLRRYRDWYRYRALFAKRSSTKPGRGSEKRS